MIVLYNVFFTFLNWNNYVSESIKNSNIINLLDKNTPDLFQENKKNLPLSI